MFNSDNKSIYGAYRNESEYTPESNLRPETQRYIDDTIIPVVKMNPDMIHGMRNYLNSQGIFEPDAVSYIRNRVQ